MADPYQVVQNFIPNDTDHVKRLTRGNRVDKHISMDTDEMFRVQDTILVLHKRNESRKAKSAQRSWEGASSM